jgi:hypothetical protein
MGRRGGADRIWSGGAFPRWCRRPRWPPPLPPLRWRERRLGCKWARVFKGASATTILFRRDERWAVWWHPTASGQPGRIWPRQDEEFPGQAQVAAWVRGALCVALGRRPPVARTRWAAAKNKPEMGRPTYANASAWLGRGNVRRACEMGHWPFNCSGRMLNDD